MAGGGGGQWTGWVSCGAACGTVGVGGWVHSHKEESGWTGHLHVCGLSRDDRQVCGLVV